MQVKYPERRKLARPFDELQELPVAQEDVLTQAKVLDRRREVVDDVLRGVGPMNGELGEASEPGEDEVDGRENSWGGSAMGTQ